MSKDKEINDKIKQTAEAETTNEEEVAGEEAVSAEKSAEPTSEERYAELNDKFLRLYSEFDNYRKRTNKEKIDLIATAGSAVLKDMLPVLDDFERAIQNNENTEDPAALKEGFSLIYTKLKSILEGKGLKSMTAKGETFDSELHEAIANIPSPAPELVGKVVEDVEKGYYLNEKVIRFAKVVVGQ